MTEQRIIELTPSPKWQTVALDNVAEIINGGTPKSKVPAYWGGDIQWLTPKEMGTAKNRSVSNTTRTITREGLAKSSARLAPPNSVILSTRAPIGHLAVNAVEMAFNQGCRGIVPGKELDPVFLYYFLDANRQELNKLGTGATFKELSATKLKSIKLPLPPVEEQKRIVAELDQAFAALNRARAHAEANLTDAWELFENFLGTVTKLNATTCDVVQLSDTDLVEIIDGDRGKNYPKKDDFMSSGDCLFLNTKNVRPNGFDFSERMFISREKDNALSKGKLRKRDVVLTTRGTIGNVGFFDDQAPIAEMRINSGMLILRPNERKLRGEFLVALIRSNVFKDQIKRYVSGAAQPQLPIRSLKHFALPIPRDINEQLDIASRLERLEGNCSALASKFQASLDDITNLRQSLLQKAFSGQLT